MIDEGRKGVSKSLANKCIAHLSQIKKGNICVVYSLVESLTFNKRLVLSHVGLKNKSHIFYSGMGVLPRKILKTKNAEAISGHFVRTILPSVNEQFQRILLPFIVCSFLYTKFRQICILSVLVLGCR